MGRELRGDALRQYQEKQREAAAGCQLSNRTCDASNIVPEDCRRCGWNVAEARRRRKLPLYLDDNAKFRKFVGVPDQAARSAGNG